MNSHGIKLKIDSDPANLAPVRSEVESLCRDAGFDEKAVGEIGLVLNEALANVMRHAYHQATDRPIEISAQVVDGECEIRVRDWGSGVDPCLLKPKPRDPNKPGGLGLICMREMMDKVEFRPQDDGMLLIMTRRRR